MYVRYYKILESLNYLNTPDKMRAKFITKLPREEVVIIAGTIERGNVYDCYNSQ